MSDIRIAVIYNANKSGAGEFANYIYDRIKDLKRTKIYSLDDEFDRELFDSDLIITIGGDGTTLKAVSFFANSGRAEHMPSFMSVNFGRKGFLSTCTKEDFFGCYERFIKNKHNKKTRHLAFADIEGKRYHFLNELSLLRYPEGRVLEILVEFKEAEIKTRADGIIVATETGSSAYAYSAGGALIYGCPKSLNIVFIASEDKLGPFVVGETHQPVEVRVNSKWSGLSLDGMLYASEGPFTIKTGISDHSVEFVY
jgi:NAD+ kinase